MSTTTEDQAIHELASRITSFRASLPTALEFQLASGPRRIIRHCRTPADFDHAMIEAHLKNWSLLGPTNGGIHCPVCHTRPCQC